jgi:hypothetical protein
MRYESITIDEGAFYEMVRDGSPFTAERAREVATELICESVCRYATVEQFQRSDTRDSYIFVIATNSMPAWRRACHAVQDRVLKLIPKIADIETRACVFIDHIVK